MNPTDQCDPHPLAIVSIQSVALNGRAGARPLDIHCVMPPPGGRQDRVVNLLTYSTLFALWETIALLRHLQNVAS